MPVGDWYFIQYVDTNDTTSCRSDHIFQVDPSLFNLCQSGKTAVDCEPFLCWNVETEYISIHLGKILSISFASINKLILLLSVIGSKKNTKHISVNQTFWKLCGSKNCPETNVYQTLQKHFFTLTYKKITSIVKVQSKIVYGCNFYNQSYSKQ